jgi:hypothetical protein
MKTLSLSIAQRVVVLALLAFVASCGQQLPLLDGKMLGKKGDAGVDSSATSVDAVNPAIVADLAKYVAPFKDVSDEVVGLQGFEKNSLIMDLENLTPDEKTKFNLPSFAEYPLFTYEAFPGFEVQYSQAIQKSASLKVTAPQLSAEASKAKSLGFALDDTGLGLKVFKNIDADCNNQELIYQANIPKYKDLPAEEGNYFFCIRYLKTTPAEFSAVDAAGNKVAAVAKKDVVTFAKTPVFALTYENSFAVRNEKISKAGCLDPDLNKIPSDVN